MKQIFDQFLQFLQQGIAAIFRFVQLVWTWSVDQIAKMMQAPWTRPSENASGGPSPGRCSIQRSLGGEIAVANLVAFVLCPDRRTGNVSARSRTGTLHRVILVASRMSGDYFNSDK
jgi:hypothetical protein